MYTDAAYHCPCIVLSLRGIQNATSATSTVVGCCLSACGSMGALGAPCILCLHCKVIHHPLNMYLMANVKSDQPPIVKLCTSRGDHF